MRPDRSQAQPDATELGWTELVPGLKLSVTGTTDLMGWRWPFTVRTTVAGLPSRMFTASCSVHVIVVPAGRVPIYICDPSVALVSSTQQSSCPVATLITTSVREGVGDTEADGVGDGVGLAGGRLLLMVFEAVGWLFLPCVEIRWYALYPITASRTTITIVPSLGERRRSRILIGVDGSKTSAARSAPGGPCTASYSLISGTRVGAHDPGDAADVTARVEIAAALGEVILFDAPDDRFPDPGLLADLTDGEAGVASRFGQGFTDAHAAPPPALVGMGSGGDEETRECGDYHQV